MSVYQRVVIEECFFFVCVYQQCVCVSILLILHIHRSCNRYLLPGFVTGMLKLTRHRSEDSNATIWQKDM
jgi:hypothetical protein